MSDFVKQLRKHLADAFPDVRVYDWDEEVRSSAVPLESMIEEMGGVHVMRISGDAWWHAAPEGQFEGDGEDGDTVYEAVSALYAAWRERE